VDITKTITHISLCSGYGGIDIGLARAIPNLRTICFCEREAFPIANLVSKMEKGLLDTAPIWTDLTTLPWGKFRGAVDLLSGGFPCQPFSAAGKRNADTDERHLFPYILQGIRECQPRLVFLENVEGIISAKLSGDGWRDPEGTPVLLHVLRELERVGYKATAGVFSASEVGAPHQRKRVFIMAYNDSNGSRQGGLLQQRTDGEITISNGESWGIELANSSNNTNTTERLCQEGSLQTEHREEVCARVIGGTDATIWPSRPGQQQYWWEPPRVVANTRHNTSERRSALGEVQEGHGCTETESQGSRAERQREKSELVCSSSESQVGNTSSLRLECPREQGGLAEEGRRTKGKGSEPASTSEEPSNTSINESNNEVESSVGRDLDGPSSGVVLTELYTTSDSRNDELRLLGNGVVPQTCTKAFIILFDKLMNEGKIKEEQGVLSL
jgi:site-specific DNA-cytosine methylase